MVIFYSYVELPEAIYKWRTVHFHVWLPQDVLVEHVAENVSGWLNDTSPSSSFQWLWGGSPHESLFAFMWTWATTWPRCVINCIASPYIWVYWERSNRTCFFCVPPRLPADRCEAALSEDIPGSQPANLGGFRKGNTTQIKNRNQHQPGCHQHGGQDHLDSACLFGLHRDVAMWPCGSSAVLSFWPIPSVHQTWLAMIFPAMLTSMASAVTPPTGRSWSTSPVPTGQWQWLSPSRGFSVH